MRFPSFFSVVGWASLAASVTLLPALPAAAQPRTPLFAADQEACFGRVYEASHLAGHPEQKVTGIHIFRSLSERPEAENWRPNQREEIIKRFRETGETNVQAFVTFRDRRGYFHNALTCNKETKSGVGCYIECDGGSFDLKRESPTTALLHNNGFVLIGGCGEDVEESQTVYFSPGKDDKVFRLESKPAGICRTEEQRAKPIRAGKPLRERFGEKEPFCFGRDYDAAHRARNPQQKVTSIRVGRLTPDQERLDKDNPQQWPEDVKLSVSLILNAGAARRAAKYTCLPQEASWECYADSSASTRSTCDGNIVQLARGPGNDIMLINRQDGLPIETACQAKPDTEPTAGEFTRRQTRSDDKMFRLARMPVEACR